MHAAGGRALMAGINVTVERMMRSQTLTGIAATYSYAALTVAGPWIFTMLSVAGLSGIGCETACDELPAFRSIIIYNSLFSLVVTSPIAFFAGRFIADRLHQGRTEHTFFVLVASLSVFLAVVLAAATPFYLLAAELSPATRIAAVQNAVLIGVSWLLIPFLAAASVGGAVLAAFGL